MASLHFISKTTISLLVLLSIAAIEIQAQAKPSFTIRNTVTGIEGSTFTVQTWTDQPTLAATAKYIAYSHLCVTGVWATYLRAENYGKNSSFPTYVYANTCAYLTITPNFIGSVRLVGEVGESRLNLYAGVDYTSTGYEITTNVSNLTTHFASLLLVGPTPVQIFHEPNHAGFSYCVQASPSSVTRLQDISSLGLQPGDIRSIKFGCTTMLGVQMQMIGIPAQDPSTQTLVEKTNEGLLHTGM